MFGSSAAILDLPYRPDAPERARAVVARLGEREKDVTAWIRAAQADGKLKAGDPAFMAMLLQGQVKAVAFWPQVTMGRRRWNRQFRPSWSTRRSVCF